MPAQGITCVGALLLSLRHYCTPKHRQQQLLLVLLQYYKTGVVVGSQGTIPPLNFRLSENCQNIFFFVRKKISENAKFGAEKFKISVKILKTRIFFVPVCLPGLQARCIYLSRMANDTV